MVGKTASVDIEPIDRLEEKIKQLVGVLERQRADQARLAEENLQLRHELEAVRAQASDVASAAREVDGLRRERDVIRTRVSGMLAALEALPL